MIRAHRATFEDGVVLTVPRGDLLELHGTLVQCDGRSDVGDRLLSIIETAIAGAPLDRFSVHVDQLPLVP